MNYLKRHRSRFVVVLTLAMTGLLAWGCAQENTVVQPEQAHVDTSTEGQGLATINALPFKARFNDEGGLKISIKAGKDRAGEAAFVVLFDETSLSVSDERAYDVLEGGLILDSAYLDAKGVHETVLYAHEDDLRTAGDLGSGRLSLTVVSYDEVANATAISQPVAFDAIEGRLAGRLTWTATPAGPHQPATPQLLLPDLIVRSVTVGSPVTNTTQCGPSLPDVSCNGGTRFFRLTARVQNLTSRAVPGGITHILWGQTNPFTGAWIWSPLPNGQLIANTIPGNGTLVISRPYFMGPCDCVPNALPPTVIQFTAIVDPNGTVPETNENNNQLTAPAPACDSCG